MARRNGGARWTNLALNAGLVLLGAVLVIFVYSLASRYLVPQPLPSRLENPAELVGEIIQVEVRNGCGVSGLAAEMTRYLRAGGFDVVDVGDYSSFDQETSLVIDRSGNPEAARQVALAVGIPEGEIVQDIRLEDYVDATVVIGKDYAALKPFRKE